MITRRNPLRTCALLCGLGPTLVFLAGCGSVQRTAKFEQGFSPRPDTRIEVGRVLNETGKTFDFDICAMLEKELNAAFKKADLQSTTSSDSGRLSMTTKIVEYKKGDAFKRWLLPGWGSTVLSVHSELSEADGGTLVGSVDVRRTVSVGGGYSIGAWKKIMRTVAKDVAKEIRRKIPK